MARKLLFSAFLLTLALTAVAAHHQLTNAAPNVAPPPSLRRRLTSMLSALHPSQRRVTRCGKLSPEVEAKISGCKT